MKIKTLVVLSLLCFIVGSAGGAAYGFIAGENVLAPVADALPSLKSPEEKMIDNFIEQQEDKQEQDKTTDTKTTDDKKEPILPATTQAKTPQDKSEDNKNTQSTVKQDEKRQGQPTVSDGKTLRVREKPSTNEDVKVLIGIPNTEIVEIIEERDGWYQIITANGTKGWASKEFMKEL